MRVWKLTPCGDLLPQIDFGAFGAAANAAFGITLSPTIDIFANDVTFLLGAFLFEDVGVTAYKVRARHRSWISALSCTNFSIS
jgi:hypothetical protein